MLASTLDASTRERNKSIADRPSVFRSSGSAPAATNARQSTQSSSTKTRLESNSQWRTFSWDLVRAEAAIGACKWRTRSTAVLLGAAAASQCQVVLPNKSAAEAAAADSAGGCVSNILTTVLQSPWAAACSMAALPRASILREDKRGAADFTAASNLRSTRGQQHQQTSSGPKRQHCLTSAYLEKLMHNARLSTEILTSFQNFRVRQMDAGSAMPHMQTHAPTANSLAPVQARDLVLLSFVNCELGFVSVVTSLTVGLEPGIPAAQASRRFTQTHPDSSGSVMYTS